MASNPTKIIQVSGTLKNESSYPLTNPLLEIETHLQREYANFNEGVWEICLKDVCIDAQKINDTLFFEVSTNFVFGQFTQTERRQPIPLERFVLKKITNETRYFNSFNRTWFTINSPSADLRIFVKNCSVFENKFPGNAKLVFVLTFLFRRVK